MTFLQRIIKSAIATACFVFASSGLFANSSFQELYMKAWRLKDENLDSAKYYCEVSESFIDESISDWDLSKFYTVKGVIYQYDRQFEQSINDLIHAQELKFKLKDSLEIAKGFNNIGTTCLHSGQYRMGLEYFNSSLKYSSADSVSVYTNIGLAYTLLQMPDSALYSFRVAERASGISASTKERADLLFNIGKLYSTDGNYFKARKYLRRGLNIQNELKDYMGMAMSNLGIGITYKSQGNYAQAKRYYEISDSISSYLNNLQLDADILKSKLFLEIHGDTLLFQLFNQWYIAEQELQKRSVTSNVAEIEAKYQTKLKDEQLTTLKERSERAEAISKRNLWLALTGGGLAISLAAVGYFLNKYRKQRQKVFEEQALKREADFNEAMAEQELAVVVKSKEARNKEKLRISEELHDNISSRLTAINLLLESNKPLDKELLKVYLKGSMKELRTVAHELANEAESGNTLKANLNSLNELISESSKIQFKAHLEGLPEKLDPNLEKHLFRIVMELMNNSIKHSGCSEVVLDIMQVEKDLIVVFEDNGEGFDLKTLNEGFGIKSIRKRAKSINAHFTIDSNPKRGATFILKAPIT